MQDGFKGKMTELRVLDDAMYSGFKREYKKLPKTFVAFLVRLFLHNPLRSVDFFHYYNLPIPSTRNPRRIRNGFSLSLLY